MTKPAIAQQPATSTWSMYRAIVGIGVLCALVIVGVYQTTAARIRNNQAQFLARAVTQVLPAADSTAGIAVDPEGRLVLVDEPAALPVFLGYGASGELVGAAVTAQGMGYQDNIRLLYAYSFEEQAITGFKVLDSKETPGLGDRVEKEPHFLANFERLYAKLAADGSGLSNPIVTVKEGEKTEPWQIDGITGATITSEAIGNIINDSANAWIPLLERDARIISDDRAPEAP
ncbi:MAG: FMN-binding protein [Gammaproteobacteria bacterium]